MSVLSSAGRWRLRCMRRPLVCLVMASCAASSSATGAHAPTSLDAKSDPPADHSKAYACVDPTDAMAHRVFQDEPCRLPLYHMPVTRDPATRWPSYRSRSDADGAHPMFWRFPVQPIGPHGVPRHSWR